MQLAYPLIQILLYFSLMLAPPGTTRISITGPDHAYVLTRSGNNGPWAVGGSTSGLSTTAETDSEGRLRLLSGDQVENFEVPGQVRAALDNDWSSRPRVELDAGHSLEKTDAGYRFLLNAGQPEEKAYEIAFSRTPGMGSSLSVSEPAPAPSSSPMPEFSPQNAQPAPLRINVLGEVASPGVYSFRSGSTAAEALGAAGGLTDHADSPGSVILRGVADALPKLIYFHPEIVRRGEATDVPLQNRDTLYIPPLPNRVQAAQTPGAVSVGTKPLSYQWTMQNGPGVVTVPPPSIEAPLPQIFDFGGVKWQAWRTLFEVRPNEGLVSLPRVRPGFEYGHWGHGRGPEVITHIGDPGWRDYRIDADLLVPGVDPALNPHGLGLDFHGAAIAFHVADRKESFNESGTSAYVLGFEGPGNWGLTAYRNNYCHQPKGWGAPGSDYERKLAGGSDVALDPVRGNRFRIEVRGERIQIWIDDLQIVDVVDPQMGDVVGGQSLDHGGVAFIGGFDAMIRLRAFSITSLEGESSWEGRKYPRK